MSQPRKPFVTVVHSLPGRIRVRFSEPPADPDQLAAAIREHPGMGRIDYTQMTRSLLVRFDPHAISQEEIALRIAFQFSLDQRGRAVRLLAAPEHEVLQSSAVLSAMGLAAAFGMRWLKPAAKIPTPLDWAAGLGTACSIVDHAWKEVRQRGYFDPEVLALAYLVPALVRGNFLKASVVTWLSTFGRHLIEVPATGVEVSPREIAATEHQAARLELVVSPDTETPEQTRILGALQGLLKYAMTGGGAHGVDSLWEEIRNVSRIHGEMLEGYGRMGAGIPIRFRQ
jgi:hypothetical protein